MFKRVCVMVGVVALALTGMALPKRVYVNASTPFMNQDGTTPATGFRRIQMGINAVDPDGGTVWVVGGTYSGTSSDDAFITITNNISVKAYGTGTPVVTGAGADETLKMTTGSIEGVTFSDVSGVVYVGYLIGDAEMKECVISNCSSEYRLFYFEATVEASDVMITNCLSQTVLRMRGSSTIRDSSVVDCTVSTALVHAEDDSRVMGCTISGNHNTLEDISSNYVEVSGVCALDNAWIMNCTISENTGGVFHCYFSGASTVLNCEVFAGEETPLSHVRESAAILGSVFKNRLHTFDTPTLLGCTLLNSGEFGTISLSSGSSPSICNCIIETWNSLLNIPATNCLFWPEQVHNASLLEDCTFVDDPLFLDAAEGDYRIHPMSAAVDAGDNSFVSLPLMNQDLEHFK